MDNPDWKITQVQSNFDRLILNSIGISISIELIFCFIFIFFFSLVVFVVNQKLFRVIKSIYYFATVLHNDKKNVRTDFNLWPLKVVQESLVAISFHLWSIVFFLMISLSCFFFWFLFFYSLLIHCSHPIYSVHIILMVM